MSKDIQFHIEDFEGPLDLLLALVQKNKMSIYDIEILVLIKQYLEVIGLFSASTMESASGFIAMAARLVQLKSAMLLPKSNDAERMREELTGLLIEYSACKEVAARLREMANGVFIAVRKPANITLESTYKGRHSISQLTSAFSGITGRSFAKRPPRAEQFDDIVTAPVVSVDSRAYYILRGLRTGSFSALKSAFLSCTSGRSVAVATFLALLELIRSGRVIIDDEENLCLANTGMQKHKAQVLAGKAEAHGT